jgi:2-polyprenyl-6-methoxyphenol hydroxylase-like FAD-dependent oxidoreductase
MSAAIPSTDVLIVGAGPTGLSLAVQLARWGVRHRVIERTPAPHETSRALGLQPRSLMHFAGMGIADAAVAAGSIPSAANVYDRERRLLRLSLRNAGTSKQPYRFMLAVQQSDVERLLATRLCELGGGVERPRELVAASQDDGGVTATLDGDERVRARWLVGCDGAHSTVRHLLGVTFAGRTYPQRFLLADAELDWPLSAEETHAWLHPDGLFACLPMTRRGRWRLFATTETETESGGGGGEPDASDEQALAMWQRLLRARTGQRSALVRGVPWTSDFQVSRRVVDRYRVGRALLAGDAAHVHSPLGGQGMNTGIQDACNLAWKLALVTCGRAPERLLDTYQEERLPVARHVVDTTDSGTRILVSGNPVLRAVRDRVLLPLLSLKAIQARMLEETFELNVNYRGSSLSRSHGRGGPRAGDLAPGGFEGTGFTLLAVGDEAMRAGHAAMAAWGGLLHVRPVAERAVPEAYHGRGSAMYVIRPDGYVGLRCRPASADHLEEYRQSLLGAP